MPDLSKLVAAAGGCLVLLLPPCAALAGPAADTVRAMYLPEVLSAMAPELRNRFVDPAKAQLDANEALAGDGDVGCIDWDLASDSQDFDQAAIKRSLKLEEKVSGDTARVTARFKAFATGDTSRILWTLKRVGGTWKVADIASLSSDWRLSELDCNPGQGGAQEGEGAD